VSLLGEPCQLLEWDTSFFGRRIAKLLHSRLTEELISSVLEWCRERSIDCLYFLADSDDPQTIWLSEEHGFSWSKCATPWKDGRTIRHLPHNGWTHDPAIRRRRISPCEIARTCYLDSRFYFDPHFSEDSGPITPG
jgi:dTDP-4-amino-4,6-dideoxy-D-galactose acyltransferase